MDEPYHLFAFNNPSDALSIIKTLEWAVVDYKDMLSVYLCYVYNSLLIPFHSKKIFKKLPLVSG